MQMIVMMDGKPDVFEGLDATYHFACSYEDTVGRTSLYAFLALAVEGSVAQIHLEVLQWNRESGVQCLEDWEKVKDFLRDNGCKKVVATYDDTNKESHWRKFISLFGFDEPRHILVSQRGL